MTARAASVPNLGARGAHECDPQSCVLPCLSSNREIIGGMIFGTTSVLALGIQPIFLGSLVDENKITAPELGIVAALELFSLALGSSIAQRWLRGRLLRSKVIAIATLLLVSDLASVYSNNVSSISVLRLTAGLLEGILLCEANVVLLNTRQPERIMALFLAICTIPQALAAFVLPSMLIPHFGSGAAFFCLAGFAAAAAFTAGITTRAREPAQEQGASVHNGLVLSATLVFCFLGIFFQGAGIFAAWNYIDRLGVQKGVSAGTIGAALSVSLFAQVVGSFLIAAANNNFPRVRLLLVATAVQAMVIFGMISLAGAGVYVAGTSVFGLLWLTVFSLQIALVNRFDGSSLAAIQVIPVGLFGSALGPMVSAAGASDTGVTGAFVIAGAFFVATGICYLLALALGRHTRSGARI